MAEEQEEVTTIPTNIPRILTMIWGEDDSVWVTLEQEPRGVRLAPGDTYAWIPTGRPHLHFEIRLCGPE